MEGNLNAKGSNIKKNISYGFCLSSHDQIIATLTNANYYICYIGASFGDPHIITFDSVEYTFNGFGEYTVLNVNNSQFILQGRMQPLNGGHNGKSPATVFTAFAMKQQGGSSIQVRIVLMLIV